MTLQFEVFDQDSGAFKYPDQFYNGPLATFDNLLEEYQSGQLRDKPYLAALDQLLKEVPDFIDVYAHIAGYWHRQGKPKKALDVALAGIGIAKKAVPEGFNGHIEWINLDNRPYLRAMHLAVLSCIRLRRHRDAINLIERMLAQNPGDNQGMRFLLGSEALRAGDHEYARRVLAEEAKAYPPCFYELALCHMLTNNWTAAATALRKGFIANQYIAERIGGNPDPVKLPISHDSNFAEPDIAQDYMGMYGALWHDRSGSFAFSRWLFNHSKVLNERSAIMECRTELFWEEDANERSRIRGKLEQLIDHVDETLSADIVTKRSNRRGQLVWPWSGPN